ncbi:hypothetical protein GGR56DRAFT_672302 [Xylariaceae sp. FL0804]|nr:hypothetical protein GGR56DRAFT_672302 [Xylariaceae sp. FL0804]
MSGRRAQDANDPRLGWNMLDVAVKPRPSTADVAALGPDFQKGRERGLERGPDGPLFLLTFLSGFFSDPRTVQPGIYATRWQFSAYPYSRGCIHITGSGVNDPLDFDVGFFSDAQDIDAQRSTRGVYKKGREIMRRTRVCRGEPPDARHIALLKTGRLRETKELEYDAEDDKAIIRFVADLSICPENVAVNSNTTALVIGEKAADIILKELGVKPRKPLFRARL